ncbi:3-keto-disaccharide hydrolase [Oleiharenicola lentus]|uniref:3-keto-disaccharide hydrolase n=1 Tax=Oleiharenicola lentus TaxID=2508720 RepID=UPI003F66C55D
MKKILSGLLALAFAAALSAAENKVSTAGWVSLFDGKSLDGWKANESPQTFAVVDGVLVVNGPRSHLFYVGPVANHDFKNFELSLEVMTFPKANSGVYLHTEWQDKGWPAKGYEIQVNNTQKDPKRTAGVYGIKDTLEAPAADNTWFTLVIRVEGKRIVTSVDGKVISDFTEPDTWVPPPQFAGRSLSHGTFALQGHDPESKVHYRNIKVRVLP